MDNIILITYIINNTTDNIKIIKNKRKLYGLLLGFFTCILIKFHTYFYTYQIILYILSILFIIYKAKRNENVLYQYLQMLDEVLESLKEFRKTNNDEILSNTLKKWNINRIDNIIQNI